MSAAVYTPVTLNEGQSYKLVSIQNVVFGDLYHHTLFESW